MLNRYPKWKYIGIFFIILVAFLYALPNLYGDDPALQISAKAQRQVDETALQTFITRFDQAGIAYKSAKLEDNSILVRFLDTETQLKAKDLIANQYHDSYTIALNLAPATPKWLQLIHADPVKLGLDLRGGVHFLMDIDVESAIMQRMLSYQSEIKNMLRDNKIRYTKVSQSNNREMLLEFAKSAQRDQAFVLLSRKFRELIFEKNNDTKLYASVAPTEIQEIRNYTLDQTISTLRNRVNELGVAEAQVMRQGLNQVVVELPGIQDTARAKDILGKTATVHYLMRDHEHDVRDALSGRVPPGSKIFYHADGTPVLLKKRVILTGDAIIGATTGFDQDNRPAVNIRIGGPNIGLFKKTTRQSIGRQMAVLYIETKVNRINEAGEWKNKVITEQKVISLATIQSALGNSFQITGLGMQEAQNLALLLRAGALPATVSIVEERTVGPSLGQDNIRRGVISMAVGAGLVFIFMMLYYSLFGIIADIALTANLLLLLAVLSWIGATLTLPGIAGIVLTMGMAVDANVLIFERIREELRRGMTKQSAIHRGFDKAFETIVDANITTLIVAVILFGIGSGPIRGFAVTLSIGILTSMFTAITCTRALVNCIYGGVSQAKLRIGI